MAWDEFERDGKKGYSGDAPLDEFAIALKKIAQKYEGRFDRKPTVDEILYSLSKVLGVSAAQYVSDPAGVDFSSLNVRRDAGSREEVVLDLSQWEAAYTDRENPGYFLIFERKNPKLNHIKVDAIDKPAESVKCTFDILTPGISDKMAEMLIVGALLKEFLKDYYTEKCSQVVFTNRKTGRSWTVPYHQK